MITITLIGGSRDGTSLTPPADVDAIEFLWTLVRDEGNGWTIDYAAATPVEEATWQRATTIFNAIGTLYAGGRVRIVQTLEGGDALECLLELVKGHPNLKATRFIPGKAITIDLG